MRRIAPLLFLALIAAKGGKKKNAAPEAPAPEPVVPVAPAEPEAVPEPVAPVAKVVRNANFQATFKMADGTSKSGKVVGVERTTDFYGDDGWTDDDKKLRLNVEVGDTEEFVPWKDVQAIRIAPGKIPDDVDCTYNSDFTPWMYDCTLRTVSTLSSKSGIKGKVINRHRWRFTMDDGSKFEFSVYKHTRREQDSRVPEFGDPNPENFALYTRLQDQLRTDLKGQLVVDIMIQ